MFLEFKHLGIILEKNIVRKVQVLREDLKSVFLFTGEDGKRKREEGESEKKKGGRESKEYFAFQLKVCP